MQMMEQAGAENGVPFAGAERELPDAGPGEMQAVFEVRLVSQSLAGQFQHGLGAVNTMNYKFRESPRHPEADIAGAAAEIEKVAAHLFCRERAVEQVDHPIVGFLEIRRRISLGLLAFIHQFRFAYPFHGFS